MDEISKANVLYMDKFGEMPPQPEGVDEDFYVRTVMNAIKSGVKIGFDFDFFPDIPDGVKI